MSRMPHMPKRARITLALASLALLAVALPSRAQFGRNKVQYREHHWQVLTTPHFEVNFYEGGERFAIRAALVLEDGYAMLSEKLDATLPWRVPVILYTNHNDFLQTNVSPGLLPEGVQAFAEPSRKRIVLPFTGSYPDFAHTAIHELAHVFTFQIVYNRLMDNVFSRNALFGMPGWMAEGVAEYLSVGWDTEADMFIRDAVIHDYLPDLGRAGGFMVYKGGQSAWNYIAQTYGREKVLDILHALSVARTSDGALESTIGLTTHELSEKWKNAMRKKYWPMYGNKTDVSDLGRRLTNHVRDRGYYNTKPVLSPDGERIAFFSDRDGLMSLYILSTIDGRVIRKLVQGHRSNRFESLHFYTSSIDWSPDGKYIALVAKTGGKDIIYVVDSHNSDVVKKFDIGADGVVAPVWSPLGDVIVVSAVFSGQTDLVQIKVNSGTFERLTNDIGDQLEPSFFPDGKRLAFVYYPNVTIPVPGDLSPESRKELAELDFLAPGNVRHDVTRDIWELDLETKEARPLIQTTGDDQSPVVFDNGEKMIFTSDVSGIRNLYVADLAKGEYRRITDVLSGVLFPDVNEENRRIAFTAFVDGGYDIYVSDDLDGLLGNNYDVQPIPALQQQLAATREIREVGAAGPDIPLSSILARKSGVPPSTSTNVNESSNLHVPRDLRGVVSEVYSVSDEDSVGNMGGVAHVPTRTPKGSEQKGSGSVTKAPSGVGRKHPIEGVTSPVAGEETVNRGGTISNYKFKLAPDFVGQGAGLYFSSGFGFGLANTIAMSDLLNNHRVVISFNLFRDIADSDLYASYLYLKKRINYGVGVFQFKNYLNSRMSSIGETFLDYRLFTERNYGFFGLISYPFDTFNRMDFDVQAFVSERQFFNEQRDPGSDVIVYREGETSTRNLIEPSLSFVHDASFFNYFGPIDGSRYAVSISKGFGVGSRAVSRTTLYADYRWYKLFYYRNAIAFRALFAGSEGEDPRAFFLGGPTTLRGWDYLELSGTRVAFASLEYRLPLIDALIFGWPGRWGFGNMGGSVFIDVGGAWDGADFQAFVPGTPGLQTKDLKADIGFGTQFYFSFLLVNLQWAWQTDFRAIGDYKFHFYLGPTF